MVIVFIAFNAILSNIVIISLTIIVRWFFNIAQPYTHSLSGRMICLFAIIPTSTILRTYVHNFWNCTYSSIGQTEWNRRSYMRNCKCKLYSKCSTIFEKKKPLLTSQAISLLTASLPQMTTSRNGKSGKNRNGKSSIKTGRVQ